MILPRRAELRSRLAGGHRRSRRKAVLDGDALDAGPVKPPRVGVEPYPGGMAGLEVTQIVFLVVLRSPPRLPIHDADRQVAIGPVLQPLGGVASHPRATAAARSPSSERSRSTSWSVVRVVSQIKPRLPVAETGISAIVS